MIKRLKWLLLHQAERMNSTEVDAKCANPGQNGGVANVVFTCILKRQCQILAQTPRILCGEIQMTMPHLGHSSVSQFTTECSGRCRRSAGQPDFWLAFSCPGFF